MRVSTSLALCAAAALALTGCSGDADDAPDLDVEYYQSVWTQNVVTWTEVRAVHDRLVRDCLGEQGFDRHLEPAPEPVRSWEELFVSFATRPSPEDAAEVGYAERYPLVFARFDEDYAERQQQLLPHDQQYSYMIARYGQDAATAYMTESATDVPRNEAGRPLEWPGMEVRELDTGEVVEWHLHGCEGEVTEALYGNDPFDFLRRQAIVTTTPWDAYNADANVLAVTAAWSACMEEAGYPDLEQDHDVVAVLSEWETELGVFDRSSPRWDEFDQRQKALAVADAECAARTDAGTVKWEAFWYHLADHFSTYDVEIWNYQDEARQLLLQAQELLAE